MSSLVISGDTSGTVTLAAPAVAGTTTLTLQAATATSSVNTLGTALAYNWNGLTTNTSLDFTALPSWIKRITVMFNGVSTNSTSNIIIQIGSGSYTISGYTSLAQYPSTPTTFTSGFGIVNSINSASTVSGISQICLLGSNIYIQNGNMITASGVTFVSAGNSSALSGALDRIRITTVNGTDTFDAGSVNLLYEG